MKITTIISVAAAMAVLAGIGWYAGNSNSIGNLVESNSSARAVVLDAALCDAYGGLPEQSAAPVPGMIWIEGGVYSMGSEEHYEDEAPVRQQSIDGFWVDSHEVTNAQFSKFVQATGYVTVAERAPDPLMHPTIPADQLVAGGVVFRTNLESDDGFNNRWAFVAGASWRNPEGPQSHIMDRANHPVVQIAVEDAEAYAEWAGNSLPSEAEWEYAARGGIERAAYAWGAEMAPEGKQLANTWQGLFPFANQEIDGFAGISPVGCYPANGYSLYDMIGNAWELTADIYDANANTQVMKGGSYLCAENYCQRYRPAARHPQERDLPTGHVGFRTIRRTS